MTAEPKEINLINRIVAEAIWHGADAGGAYYQNEENLIGLLNDWISYRSLHSMYEVCCLEVKISVGYIIPDIPQIIKKTNVDLDDKEICSERK